MNIPFHKKCFTIVAILALFFVLNGSTSAQIEEGVDAPNFTLKNLEGKEVSLNEFRGKYVLVNFWATWCAPCKKEMPSLDNLDKDSNFKNLKVFPVNVGQDNALKTKNFFNDLNIQNLEIFFDSNLNLVNEFKLRGVPTTILINKKGEEFARIIGEVNFQDKKFSKWLLKYD